MMKPFNSRRRLILAGIILLAGGVVFEEWHRAGTIPAHHLATELTDTADDHPTISSLHCELALTDDGVYLHDCDSTNGTFINGDPVMEAWLDPGQKLRLGDVELLVESTDASVAIPQFERPRQIMPPPIVLPDGALSCPRHEQAHATYRCPHCKEVMCNACVHVLRRKGGTAHFLCVICSSECEPIQTAQPKKKKGFLGILQDTVKLKFKHTIRRLNGGN